MRRVRNSVSDRSYALIGEKSVTYAVMKLGVLETSEAPDSVL